MRVTVCDQFSKCKEYQRTYIAKFVKNIRTIDSVVRRWVRRRITWATGPLVNDDLVHEIKEEWKQETYPEVTVDRFFSNFCRFLLRKIASKQLQRKRPDEKMAVNTPNAITGGIVVRHIGVRVEHWRTLNIIGNCADVCGVRRWPRDVDPGSGVPGGNGVWRGSNRARSSSPPPVTRQ